jgi:glyoxylase-like metal-dependent hydrolase (beta-lactamase superfamily II)
VLIVPDNVKTTKLGAATVTIVDLYDILFNKMSELVDAPKDERTPADDAILRQSVNLAVQCVYVRLPQLAILVDAGAYEAAHDSSGRTGYTPPPGLLESLARVGARPDDIDHVVITHAHGDHFNFATCERAGRYEPTFPRAQVYLGRADWEAPSLQKALSDESSLESRAFGPLQRAGRLVPVDGDRELGDGVAILAAPGESPGHQILRVRSEGKTLYCVGDLWHHSIEVGHPAWTAPWSNREVNVRSRRAVAEAALGENALLVATHIAGFGRLRRTATGVEWGQGL